MTPTPTELAEHPRLAGALAALNRAAQRASEIAARTRTYVVVVRDGELMWEVPGREYFPKPAPPKT